MRRNLVRESVDDEKCEEGYPVFGYRIVKEGYNTYELYKYVIQERLLRIANKRYQSHLIDQSVTKYAVINRRGTLYLLSDPDQIPSENGTILVCMKLQLCLTKCVCKKTMSFMHPK